MMRFMRLMGGLVMAVTVAACQEAADPQAMPEAGTALPPGHPDISGAAPQMVQGEGPVGEVLETMDSGGYTYALLDVEGDEIWTAGPVTALAVGDSVVVVSAMGMQDFHSNSLDRTFEQILFLPAFGVPGASSGTFAGNRGLVTETVNAGGYTYALVEIAGESMWLAGPEISLAVGDTVGWMDGQLMQDFSSTSLDRTWEYILFVDGFTVLN
jgi:hypothetical protein